MDYCLTLFAATNPWSDPGTYIAILKVIFGLGAVIFVHELGHFLLAKMCGVKCDKFYVGFDVPIRLFGQTIIPAKLFSFKWGETEYGIGAIPLGGYVKMLGQDDNPGHSEEQIKESLAEGESAESAILASGMVDQSKLDPRSFLAKSVTQRMLIISAGVVFNLLFAILFAAIAFRNGVDYQPPVLGSVKGGGPAWKHDMAGAEITSVDGRKVEGYYTYMHFAESVILNTDESSIPIEFKRPGSDEIVSIDVTPERGFLRENPEFALIGVEFSLLPKISQGAVPGSPAAAAQPAFEAGDLIVDINGTSIETEVDLRRALFRDANIPVTFTLERTVGEGDEAKTETIKTSVGVTPEKVVGFSTTWGPIAAIKLNSPASKAGLQEGDLIKQIDGAHPGDLLTLDNRMFAKTKDQQTVALQVERAGKLIDVSIQPELPKLASTLGPNKPIAIDSLGIAIEPSLTIDTVTPDSPADQAGMLANDELISVKYLLDEKQLADERYANWKKRPLVKFVKDNTSWAEVYEKVMQSLEAGSKFEITVQRGDETKVLQMTSIESDEFFRHTRGIYLEPLEHHYESDNWSDAFATGGFKMLNDLQRVGKTLKKLVLGKISPTNLGGPGTIAAVATNEAAASTSRLLLFLTFLSANLAIVNFLPIPVLDGGHMMFLAYEGIFRRPVNERVQLILTYGGLAFVLCLMVFVISMDIGRFAPW